ncbi:MAG: Uma2 family endonuclease, partial [Fischerella sp.]|nr:Uma2 family endonuclease [Fischerella sp.]
DGYQRCYLPDITVINSTKLEAEPFWEERSTLTLGASIPLVVEVVRTNWRDDYYTKRGAYEGLGIAEYWIVDHQALGGTQVIGKPKQPTISIYSLVESEYQVSQYRATDRIVSPTFPELNVTVQQVFEPRSRF